MKNPQAFPTHDQEKGTDPRNQILTGGMTLRDYFSAAALTGMLSNVETVDDVPYISICAYRIADAMLKERGKDEKPTSDNS